jgi:hypothetical protein
MFWQAIPVRVNNKETAQMKNWDLTGGYLQVLLVNNLGKSIRNIRTSA